MLPVEQGAAGQASGLTGGGPLPCSCRFVVDRDREVLVGATFVGAEVADFLQAATIAIVAAVPLSMLAHAIAPFPTRSELWLKFLEAYEAERDVSLHATRALVALGR